ATRTGRRRPSVIWLYAASGSPALRAGDSLGAALPVRRAELALEHLPGAGLRQRLCPQLYLLGHLVARDQLPAVRDQRLRIDLGPRHDDRVHGLPPTAVGDPEHGGFGDRGMAVERLLDLGAEHVLAASDDHVLGAVDEIQVAAGVLVAQIAGAIPAIDE